MSRIVRFEGTAMMFRTGLGLRDPREVFVRDRGWIEVEALQVGDHVSRGTLGLRHLVVSAIEDE